jgi:hypothetical protein
MFLPLPTVLQSTAKWVVAVEEAGRLGQCVNLSWERVLISHICQVEASGGKEPPAAVTFQIFQLQDACDPRRKSTTFQQRILHSKSSNKGHRYSSLVFDGVRRSSGSSSTHAKKWNRSNIWGG